MSRTAKHQQNRALHYLRRLSQLAVVVAAAVTGYRFFAGLGLTTVEKYCPMGGLATGYSVLTGGTFSCATGEFNFSLFIALLLLALLLRKSFCSWLCPVGTVSELVGLFVAGLRRRVTGKRRRNTPGGAEDLGLVAPPRKVDRWLRILRYAVLAAVLAATIATAELIFRPFCPYYVLFSFHGHEVQMWSYALLALFFVGIIVLPMIWCRYLCPLGGALWPFARIGLVRIRRNESACIDCGRCDAACAQSLPVATCAEMTSGECTLCLACTQSCPAPGALEVGLPRRKRISAWLVPVGLALVLLLGLVGGRSFTLPSVVRDFEGTAQAATTESVSFTVKGVRCVDTAELAISVFDGFPGIGEVIAYASRNEVVVEYDPDKTNVKTLRRLLDGPVYVESLDEFVYHLYVVQEIDGTPVPPRTGGTQ